MQISAMREFLTLAQKLNYLAASEELYMSQATLSRHIKDLEKELGYPLFRRSTRKVELTSFGIRMIPYAKRAIALEEDLKQGIADYEEHINSSITIGCAPHCDHMDFGRLIAEFQKTSPGIHISIIAQEADRLLQMLDEEECSFVLLRATDPPSENSIPMYDDPLYVFLPQDHPMADRERISLSDLRDEFFLLGGDGELSYELGLAACREAGFEPRVLFRGAGPQQINIMSQGLGVSLMFDGPLFQNVAHIVKRPVDTGIAVKVYLVYRPDSLSQAGRKLLDFLLKYEP